MNFGSGFDLEVHCCTALSNRTVHQRAGTMDKSFLTFIVLTALVASCMPAIGADDVEGVKKERHTVKEYVTLKFKIISYSGYRLCCA